MTTERYPINSIDDVTQEVEPLDEGDRVVVQLRCLEVRGVQSDDGAEVGPTGKWRSSEYSMKDF